MLDVCPDVCPYRKLEDGKASNDDDLQRIASFVLVGSVDIH